MGFEYEVVSDLVDLYDPDVPLNDLDKVEYGMHHGGAELLDGLKPEGGGSISRNPDALSRYAERLDEDVDVDIEKFFGVLSQTSLVTEDGVSAPGYDLNLWYDGSVMELVNEARTYAAQIEVMEDGEQSRGEGIQTQL